MVYVTPIRNVLPNKNWPYRKACYLLADSVEELHIFASSRLLLKRSWFQARKRLPHYDLTPGKRWQAVRMGAIEITNKELFEKMKEAIDAKEKR